MSNKINVTKYSKLVAYGCSWTAGSELQDHIALKMSETECDNLKKKLGLHGFGNRYDKIIRNRGAEVAWPAELGRRANLPVVNRAAGGASVEYSLYHFQKDIQLRQVTSDSLVIVGLTTPDRQLVFKNHLGEGFIQLLPGSDAKAFGWKSSNTKFLWNCFLTDERLAYNYANFINLMRFHAQKNNIDLHFLKMDNLRKPYLRSRNKCVNNNLLMTFKEIEHTGELISTKSLHDFNNNDAMHGFNHVKAPCHSRFARHLYDNHFLDKEEKN